MHTKLFKILLIALSNAFLHIKILVRMDAQFSFWILFSIKIIFIVSRIT